MRTSPGYTLPSLGGDAAAKLGCRCRWSNRRFGDGPFEVPVGERSLGQHNRRDGRKIGVGAPVFFVRCELRASSFELRAWLASIGVRAWLVLGGSLPRSRRLLLRSRSLLRCRIPASAFAGTRSSK